MRGVRQQLRLTSGSIWLDELTGALENWPALKYKLNDWWNANEIEFTHRIHLVSFVICVDSFRGDGGVNAWRSS